MLKGCFGDAMPTIQLAISFISRLLFFLFLRATISFRYDVLSKTAALAQIPARDLSAVLSRHRFRASFSKTLTNHTHQSGTATSDLEVYVRVQ